MARRANSKIRPAWLLFIGGALALVIGIGAFLQWQGGEPFRTVPDLPAGDYLSNANSLRGNVYKVRGTIYQSLGYSRSKGRLFSVETSSDGGGGGSNNGSDVLPILIPPELSYLNLQKGQRYVFRLEVGDAGVLRALEMKKR